MRSNKHLRTFPIASGNQEKQKFLSIEIDVKFLVIHFLLLFWYQTTESVPQSNMFDVESNKMADKKNIVPRPLTVVVLSDRAATYSFPGILLKFR